MTFALTPIRHSVLRVITGISLTAFLVLWSEFDCMGSYHHFNGTPSPSALWIVIPTIEALTYGSLIAFYDGAKFKMPV